MRTFESIDLSPQIYLDFYLSRKFKNVFELAYALTDLHSVISTFYYAGSNKLEKKKLPTTSRNFTKSFENALTLKDFRSGSFGAEVASTVITSLLFKFIERYFTETQQNTDNHQRTNINININALIYVTIHDSNQRTNIDQLINQTTIVPGDLEASVRNFVTALSNSQIPGANNFIYDENGIRILTTSIERLGRSIDIHA